MDDYKNEMEISFDLLDSLDTMYCSNEKLF
jgi:hypothetical protein